MTPPPEALSKKEFEKRYKPGMSLFEVDPEFGRWFRRQEIMDRWKLRILLISALGLVLILIVMMCNAALSESGEGKAGSADGGAQFGNAARRQTITRGSVTDGASGQQHSVCGLTYPAPPDPNCGERPAEQALWKRIVGAVGGTIFVVAFLWIKMRAAERRYRYWRRKR